MIDKAYWNRVAAEWKKLDDGIGPGPEPPIVDGDGIDWDPIGITDDEIDDILADLDLDDL